MIRKLQGETGSTAAERRAEIVRMLPSLQDHIDEMNAWEQQFVTSMADSVESETWEPSPNQLFKARDLNMKY